jgi:hypothetical protein
MSYPRQSVVTARLEKENRVAMRRFENGSRAGMLSLWNYYKQELRKAVISRYGYASVAGQNWTLATARQGALQAMRQDNSDILAAFKRDGKRYIGQQLERNYRMEYLRQAWALDMTTPPKCKPILKPNFREASAVKVYSGRDAVTKWFDRFDAWTNAYQSATYNHLMLNAVNEGSSADAAKEIDATRVGTPAMGFWDIIDRLFTSQMLLHQAYGREDFAEQNNELLMTEIWQTMEDERVCEICGPLNGVPMSDVEEDQPAHPNCRCFSRLVPKSYADLLAGEDPEAAHELDRRGLVPDAMIIRDESGTISGLVMVNFDKWLDGQPYGIRAGL